MSTVIQELLRRIESLRKSNVYTSTICEYFIDVETMKALQKDGHTIKKRDCRTYPFEIVWNV